MFCGSTVDTIDDSLPERGIVRNANDLLVHTTHVWVRFDVLTGSARPGLPSTRHSIQPLPHRLTGSGRRRIGFEMKPTNALFLFTIVAFAVIAVSANTPSEKKTEELLDSANNITTAKNDSSTEPSPFSQVVDFTRALFQNVRDVVVKAFDTVKQALKKEEAEDEKKQPEEAKHPKLADDDRADGGEKKATGTPAKSR
ncbi:unnamed protein product, partial [Mesorhabditis spiculigera]